jgi:sulfite reductase alpha subunit-like flavoprotein
MSPAAEEATMLSDGKAMFCVFGLGRSTTYSDRYQAVGLDINRRMAELGCRRFLEFGEGDDDGDIEADWETWQERFWAKFDGDFPLEEGEDATGASPDEEFEFEELTEQVTVRPVDMLPQLNTHKGPVVLNTVEVRDLRKDPNHVRKSYHVELDSAAANFEYATGDHLLVWPKNSPMIIEELAERLGVALEQPVHVKTSTHLPLTPDVMDPTNIRTLFERYVDINGVIKKRMVRLCAEYATDPKEKEFLLGLVDDHEAFKKFSADATRHSLMDLLRDSPSVKIPVAEMVRVAFKNPMQYRAYSIASSALAGENVFLCVDMLDRRLESTRGRVHHGTASHYLAHLRPGIDHARCYRKSVEMQMADPAKPVILAGAASGMALLRAVIAERMWHEREGRKVGPTTLFYGCFLESDFLYGDEMREYERQGLLAIHPAFSHEQEERIFVQHRMLEQAEMVWDQLTKQGGQLYICGNALTLGKGVHDALVQIAERVDGLTPHQAEMAVRRLWLTNVTEDVF